MINDLVCAHRKAFLNSIFGQLLSSNKFFVGGQTNTCNSDKENCSSQGNSKSVQMIDESDSDSCSSSESDSDSSYESDSSDSS